MVCLHVQPSQSTFYTPRHTQCKVRCECSCCDTHLSPGQSECSSCPPPWLASKEPTPWLSTTRWKALMGPRWSGICYHTCPSRGAILCFASLFYMLSSLHFVRLISVYFTLPSTIYHTLSPLSIKDKPSSLVKVTIAVTVFDAKKRPPP